MIPLFKVKMTEDAINSAVAVLQSGYIGQGPKVAQFELELQKWFECGYVLTTNSATSALHLALRLAGVGAGDEVISTPMTCAATNVPILERGARIVWADIDPWSGNIDPESVRQKITAKTRAIVAVHWAGYPCELEEINAMAREHGISVIEDAAHAFGASYKGRAIGSISDYTAFSFQAIKHLTTGDGGALTCRKEESYQRGKLLRWYGIDREGSRKDFRCEEDIVEHGYKFHMNDIAAGIGLGQLSEISNTLEAHRANARFYREGLSDITGVGLMREASDRVSSHWLFTLRHKKRDELVSLLNKNGVMASQVHARNDFHTAFKNFACALPGVDEFSKEQLNIPVGWWLSASERELILTKVKECILSLK